MKLETLDDIRTLMRQLPAEHRERRSWRHVTAELDKGRSRRRPDGYFRKSVAGAIVGANRIPGKVKEGDMRNNTIAAVTTGARLEAVELALLAVLRALPAESRAVVRSQMAHFVGEDITAPPSFLVATEHAQLFRDALSERMQYMIKAIDQAG
jgi:hypothetical protein